MSKRPAAPQSALNRKQLSRREKEQRDRRNLIIGTAAVLAVIVLILGWGLADQYVLKPRRPVATVAGDKITVAEYQKMVNYRRWDYANYVTRLREQQQQLGTDEKNAFLVQYISQQLQQIQAQIPSIPQSVLDELIDERITRQEAQKRGITVTADEVQIRLEQQFGYERYTPTPSPTLEATPTSEATATSTATPEVTATQVITETPAPTETLGPTSTPAPTPTPISLEEFNRRKDEYFGVAKQAGLTEADFRRLIESGLYQEKLTEALNAEAPTTAEQIHARHILLKTKEEAEAALARIKGGEDFATVAAELSTDTSNKDQGGDLGWFPRGQMVEEFDAAAFALQPGQMSEVVETSFGFHIIKVEEREANRPLEELALQQAQSKYVDEWYTQRRAAPDVVRSWDSTMVPKDTTASTAGQ